MAAITLGTAEGLRTIGDARGDPLDGTAVTTLVAGADGVLWAVADDVDLYRIDSDGESAEFVAAADEAVRCAQVHAGTVWCGTAGARLLRLAGDRLEPVGGFDEAPTHDEWHTPWGGPAAVWTMASDGTRLFVNVHVGGILRSDDDGRSWTPTIDLHDDVHQVLTHAGVLWAATGAGALARSMDGGSTWEHFDDLDEAYLRSVAPAGDGVVVGGSVGPFAETGRLYRFDGDTFHALDGGLPDRLGGNVDAYRLTSDGTTIVVADPGGAVYRSDDGGVTWAVAAEDVPEVRAVVIA